MRTHLALPVLALTSVALLAGCAGGRSPAEANTQRLVAEDDQVRIEELRVRGLTQALTVQPKLAGAPRYDNLPTPAGEPNAPGRGAAGQRVWPVLSF